MNRFLAHLISVICQPLLMPTLLFGTIFLCAPSVAAPLTEAGRWRLLLIIFLLTFGLPIISLLLFRVTRTITTLSLRHRKERLLPFILITFFYGAGTYLLSGLLDRLPAFVSMLYLTMAMILLITVVTFFWKISVHSAAMAACSGFLYMLNLHYPDLGLYYPFLAYLLLTGATMSARLELKAHTLQQVMVGAATGIVFSLVGMWWLL